MPTLILNNMMIMNKIVDNFVEKVKDYLIEKNINVVELSKQLNIPNKTLYSWLDKTRVPKIDSIWLVADLLGVSIDYLVGREK